MTYCNCHDICKQYIIWGYDGDDYNSLALTKAVSIDEVRRRNLEEIISIYCNYHDICKQWIVWGFDGLAAAELLGVVRDANCSR